MWDNESDMRSGYAARLLVPFGRARLRCCDREHRARYPGHHPEFSPGSGGSHVHVAMTEARVFRVCLNQAAICRLCSLNPSMTSCCAKSVAAT